MKAKKHKPKFEFRTLAMTQHFFRREFLKLLPPLATLCHGNGDADAAAAAGNGRRQTLVENGAVQVGFIQGFLGRLSGIS